MLGLQAHATHFVVLPAVAGALVLLGAAESGRHRTIFASGLLFGLAFLMKQHGALFGVFGFFYLAWSRARTQTDHHAWSKIRARSVRFDWMKYGKELGAYAAGLSLPYLFTIAALLATGVLPRFVFWTISYASKYISAVPLSNGPAIFRKSLNVVTSPNLFFWLLAAFGAILLWNERRMRRHQFFLPGLFVCSCISISLGLYFREHYFILLLPALALLAGVAVGRAWHLLKTSQSVERFAAVPAIGLFVMGLGFSLILHGEIWFGLSPVKACRQIYGDSLFADALGIGGYLKTNTLPNETIAVLGSEPEIYFYARRHSATGYIYMYPLKEAHAYALKMQEEMIHEVETARPQYIVFVNAIESWLPQPGSKSLIENWWPGYSKAHYDLVRTIDIEAEQIGDKPETPPSPSQVFVLKRKPSP